MSTKGGPAEHEKRGHAALKPSYLSFRFSPDYDVASMEFEEAAKLYAGAGDFAKAVKMHIEIASLRRKQHDAYGSARNLEQAAGIVERNLRDSGQAIGLYRDSAVGFCLADKPDTAARLYSKIADIYVTDKKMEEATDACKDAVRVYEPYGDTKDHMSSDVYKTCVNLEAEVGRYDACLETLEEHNQVLRRLNQLPALYKNYLSAVVIRLSRGDVEGADEVVNKATGTDVGFLGSKEFGCASEAIDAMRNSDQEELDKCVAQQTFSFLPVAIVKLARKLVAPQMMPGSNEDAKDAADMML